MSVREIQSQSESGLRWTEVCAGEHAAPAVSSVRRQARAGTMLAPGPTGRPAVGPALRPATRPTARPGSRPGARSGVRGSGTSAGRTMPTRSVAPGRRVAGQPVSQVRARACGIETRPAASVVDDVPTWVLLTCGLVVGIVMLLALAFLGGPAYA